ncbi:MAG: hypothetical protein A2V85_15510 [Chloroflexi bacterium RBG_16_72_14]|nr:MAG: hypothetical protein A2V85_15510 [Chloroflexi bacterium RBG_16_72_14]
MDDDLEQVPDVDRARGARQAAEKYSLAPQQFQSGTSWRSRPSGPATPASEDAYPRAEPLIEQPG